MLRQKNYFFLVLLFSFSIFQGCTSQDSKPENQNLSNEKSLKALDQQKDHNLVYSQFREKLLSVNVDSIYEYWSHYPPRLRQNFEYIIVEWNINDQTSIIKMDNKGNSQFGNSTGVISTLAQKPKISKSEVKRFLSESGRFRASAHPIDHTEIVDKNTIQFFMFDGIGANVVRYSIKNKKLHPDQSKMHHMTLEMEKKFIEN